VTDPVVELAENANTYTPLLKGDERIVTDRYVLWLGSSDHPSWNVAQRFRLLAGDLDAVRGEIHESLALRGRRACTWEIGSSATPPDLVERLLGLGLVDDDEPLAVGMALTEPLRDPPPPGIEVRRSASMADERTAAEIAAVCFGAAASPREPDASGAFVTYLAYLDGVPVARATGAFSDHGVTLFGGATLPDARGRGAYRALVHARFEDAVARGTPVAVTQAGRQSRPILGRLGFREVCTIRILVDRF
jgi:GNAT superfamily N-acetyltransferase